MDAAITAIEYQLPERQLTNEELAREFPKWPPDKVSAKTGIHCRRLAADTECASDLAVACGRKLLARGVCRPEEIDFLIVCTQSPDYLLPTTACLVQERLALPTGIGAFDINLGCSGYVYALAVARGLVVSGEARNVLLVTADTYSKHLDPLDFGVRALFGDGAAATLVQAKEAAPQKFPHWTSPFVYGTDGRGEKAFLLRRGGMRQTTCAAPPADAGQTVAGREPLALFMDGPEIFSFTLRVVPETVDRLLQRSQLTLKQIDMFAFHQANRYMLEHLRNKLGIPESKFLYAMSDCGNTVSSSIPIALRRAADEGRIRAGDVVMLVGFGVGYSWGAGLISWCSA